MVQVQTHAMYGRRDTYNMVSRQGPKVKNSSYISTKIDVVLNIVRIYNPMNKQSYGAGMKRMT